MKNIALGLIIFAAFFIYSCQGESKQHAHSVDLLEYGIPMSIAVPVDSPIIKTEDWIVKKGVTVKANDQYDLQVFYQDASTSDLVSLKANALAEVKGNRYFSAIVEENEAGFVYESKIDSSNINYGFRHIRLQGNKEFTFQQSMIGTFDLEAVQSMYKAVQEGK